MPISHLYVYAELNVNGTHNFNNKKRERTDWKINILAGKRMFHVDVELSFVVMISFACKWNGFRQSVKLSWYYIISMMFELV